MTLFAKIKKEYLKTRKEKKEHLIWLLSSIISEIQTVAKNNKTEANKLDNQKIIKIIKNELNWLNQQLELYKKQKRTDKINEIQEKINLLNKYIPQPLSKEELIKIIKNFKEKNNIKSLFNSRKELFNYLKENYWWQYDWKIVNDIINNL